jgi:hypothetical protein
MAIRHSFPAIRSQFRMQSGGRPDTADTEAILMQYQVENPWNSLSLVRLDADETDPGARWARDAITSGAMTDMRNLGVGQHFDLAVGSTSSLHIQR